ncbi:MAG: acetate--CoA ligase family protein [Thermoplasmata archaeon]|nr:acetate--CoA ligase family protein [Thermoplasmata archaeon]MCI4361696.1 acetate--CoA ligase family protein [Thermoplasmata archaeon]
MRDRSLPGHDELFRPHSVAVVGASNRPGAVGASLFRNILGAGFQGVVYPVNPRWPSVSGVRCYPSVDQLPETPELAVVIVPAPQVAGVVDELGRKGTRGVVVISAGFREVGGAGVALEAALVDRARHYGMSLVGPNCFGLLNTDPTVGLNATFSDTLPPRGHIAFVSQSGALCAGILRYGIAERIGFSRFVSIGNRAGVDENDLLRCLADDPATGVVLLYVENLADGHRFLETAREVTERKPVLVIKSGRSPAGERAARSHTGSLAHSAQDKLYDALFEQSGVIRVDSIGELFRAAKVHGAGLTLAGPRLAILTNSGGPGIVAADACARLGLELPRPNARVADGLRRLLSPSASVGNPVDMTADAGGPQYSSALARLLASSDVDGALVIATPTGTLSGDAAAAAILAGRGRSRKPVAACLFGLTDLSREVGQLEDAGVPTFTFPEEAVSGLATLSRYRAWRTRPRTRTKAFPVDRAAVRRSIAAARRSGTTVLPEYSARSLVEAYGIEFAPSRGTTTLEGAIAAADEIGYPVVLKVASPDISHKTDVGGVATNLGDAATLRAAWTTMRSGLARRAPKAHIQGFEVEAMVRGGHEVLVGAQRDATFGPVVVFGMGGIYVEVLQDVTFRLAPIRPLSAVHMVDSVRSAAMLRGVRGEPPGDLPALYEAIERVSQLIVECPEVAELDLNPLIVRPMGEGVVAVDARVALDLSSRSARRASPPR